MSGAGTSDRHELTSFAASQTQHLKKSLGRFDIVFIVISAILSIEILSETASFGGQTFTWTLVLAITFLLPYGLIFAETGSTFIGEGGAYLWVRRAFGRPAGALASLLSWVTQPVWVGGSMSFLAVGTWDHYISPIPTGSVADYVFKLVFIWATVLAAIVSLSKAKWLPTLGGVLKVIFLGLFLVTTVLYALKNGVAGLGAGDFVPTAGGLFGLAPLLLFGYLGFEASNSASGEMKNPEHDIPVSIARSGAISAACYLLPVLAMLVVLPAEKITGISGLLDAVGEVFTVYGAASEPMLFVAAVTFVVILLSQGSAWMIMSDRMQGLTAADGSFFRGFFGHFHPALGTPVNVNLLSGVVATVFMIAAMQVTGTSAALFAVVLSIAISTFLLSYLLIIPAAIKLRFIEREARRPFRVPVSNRGFLLMGVLCYAWVLLGSWTAVFPGTLEPLFGLEYDFEDVWGVGYLEFNILTLGTIGVLVTLGLIGYFRGKPLRKAIDRGEEQPAEVPAL